MSILVARSVPLIASIVIACVLCARLGKRRTPFFSALFGLASLAAAVEVFGLWSALNRIDNTPAYNAFIAIEFLLVLAMVSIERPHWKKWTLLAGALGLMAYTVVILNNGFAKGIRVDAMLVFAAIGSMLILALLWSYAQQSTVALHRLPAFWIFLGLLIYYGCLIPLVGLNRYVLQGDRSLAMIMWSITTMLAIIRYSIASYACWLQRRNLAG